MNNEPLTYLVRQKFTEKLEVFHPPDKGRPTNYYGKPFPVYIHPHNDEKGEWIRCDESMPTDADWGATRLIWYWEKGFESPRVTHFVTFYSDLDAQKYGYWMPTGLKRPAPPTKGAK